MLITHGATNKRAGVDANSKFNSRKILLGKIAVEFSKALVHLDSGVESCDRIVLNLFRLRTRQRRTKHCHDGISDVLIDHSAVLHDAVGHGFKILIEPGQQLLRRQRLRNAGKTANVHKQHRRS